MPEISFFEFAASLKRSHPQRRALIKKVGEFHYRFCTTNGGIRFARKADDLLEMVKLLSGQRTPPIVDKTFGIVFGVPEGFHENFRAVLYQCVNPKKAEGWSTTVNARDYIKDGHGYYISSMARDVIVCGETYREDRWDKDVFPLFSVFRDPMGR